jgi:tetratricopeptide (TPR) repeat protein
MKKPIVSPATEKSSKADLRRGNLVGAFKTIMKDLHATHDESDRSYNQAIDAFKKGDYQSAMAFARQSMKGHPRDPDAWWIISESQFHLGLYLEAARSCEKRAAIDPSDKNALIDVADNLRLAKKHGLALEACEKMLARYKGDADTLSLKAKILGEMGKKEASIDLLRHVLATVPKHALSWYELGWALHKMQDYAGAIDAMQRYVKLEPKDGNGHYCLAIFFHDHAAELQQKDLVRAAAKEYKIALKYNPTNVDARDGLLAMLAFLGKDGKIAGLAKLSMYKIMLMFLGSCGIVAVISSMTEPWVCVVALNVIGIFFTVIIVLRMRIKEKEKYT